MAKENAELLELFEKGEESLEAEIAEKDETIRSLRADCEELSHLEKEHHVEMEQQDAKCEQVIAFFPSPLPYDTPQYTCKEREEEKDKYQRREMSVSLFSS